MPPLEGSGPATGPTTAPSTAQQQRIPIHKPFTQSRLPPDLPMHPAPRHITEEELRVLETCLHRWRSEVENDTRGRSIGLSFEAPNDVRVNITLTALNCVSCSFPRSSGQYNKNPQNH